mmetsp:Transcript_8404/g.13729  ORF Transcript_8404/g.13729 Transcript_8404/m.13729 type:complete len:378 (-) Transcript_8404:231-1364(-)|eukprot:CAMPEP_0184656078 /NCGR_PEP_ID=MMETSP0308-20130426/15522_1 /TAXON_ID=38269 /ORGANISM="Gloeochaete witrockiana, Strain SAG 46.84" /LENGTH=377 /DNA_ID=CAMNT_0027093003 /DNA_START=51 /DNA_END=1184 /DNA_ORIENTATION=+
MASAFVSSGVVAAQNSTSISSASSPVCTQNVRAAKKELGYLKNISFQGSSVSSFGGSSFFAGVEGTVAKPTESVDLTVRAQAVAGAKKKDVPLNLFRPANPYIGQCIYNQSIVGDDVPAETRHIIFSHEGKVPYVEGQSIGIIPPGNDAKGNPHKLRLYSIASTRHGDFGDDKTVSLSVKRLVYNDADGKEIKGVCSNFLCNLQPGDEVKITGPVGTAMLLPDDPTSNIIMLATGTGIAPFRAYLRRFFEEKHPDYEFKGQAYLYLGVPYSSTLLYREELEKMAHFNKNFHLSYAISREQTTASGDKMYIQNRIEENAEEFWKLLNDPKTTTYMCGLRGMEDGIEKALSDIAVKAGTTWPEFVKSLKKAGRWHVETY